MEDKEFSTLYITNSGNLLDVYDRLNDGTIIGQLVTGIAAMQFNQRIVNENTYTYKFNWCLLFTTYPITMFDEYTLTYNEIENYNSKNPDNLFLI